MASKDALFKASVVALGLVCATVFGAGNVLARDKQVRKSAEEKVHKAAEEKVKDVKDVDEGKWEEQAEKSFGVGKGQGKKLMTKEEWREHQKKMQSMTPEEKEQYRKEVHERMKERAKEKGITMPEAPGPHGPDHMKGSGKGMSKGKMGGGH